MKYVSLKVISTAAVILFAGILSSGCSRAGGESDENQLATMVARTLDPSSSLEVGETPAESTQIPTELTATPEIDAYIGWKAYTNVKLGYSLKYPGDVKIMGADRDKMVQFEGPLVDNEYWPVFSVEHYDSEFYRPPTGTDVRQWIADADFQYDELGDEMAIAELPAVHLVYQEGPQAYGSDDYYFISGEQLFHIKILHTGGRQDWAMYDAFLNSFKIDQGGPQPGSSDDDLSFVADITIPDGTPFEPEEAFVKTWRLRNSGETTWTTEYALMFDKGHQMDGPDSLALPEEVLPGQTVDVSVELIAPEEEGEYIGYWMLRNEDNVPFGMGPDSDQPFFVHIKVLEPGSSTPTPTPLASGSTVTNANLNVDQSSYSGVCPITLTFSGVIYSQGAGSFVYQMEAGSNTPGFEFYLPGHQTATFDTDGNHHLDVSYTLVIEDSVDGWARLYISAPNTVHSATANFSVTCQ